MFGQHLRKESPVVSFPSVPVFQDRGVYVSRFYFGDTIKSRERPGEGIVSQMFPNVKCNCAQIERITLGHFCEVTVSPLRHTTPSLISYLFIFLPCSARKGVLFLY